mgnify:FL=1
MAFIREKRQAVYIVIKDRDDVLQSKSLTIEGDGINPETVKARLSFLYERLIKSSRPVTITHYPEATHDEKTPNL